MTDGRERWTSRGAFIMAAVGSAVGLGNVWRFPFVAYKSGGGAFFVPYLIALLTAGIPVMMLEYALGTRFQCGAPRALGQIHKGFKWVGWLAVLVALSITFYYVVIMAYSWEYMFASVDRAWEKPTSSQTVFKVPYILVGSEEEKEALKQQITDDKSGLPSHGIREESENFLMAEVVVESDLEEFVKERLALWDLGPGDALSREEVVSYAHEYYEQGLHDNRFEDPKPRAFIGPWDAVDELEHDLDALLGAALAVGVLYPKDERAVVLARPQPAVQSRPHTADMQIPSGRRCKPNANFRHGQRATRPP